MQGQAKIKAALMKKKKGGKKRGSQSAKKATKKQRISRNQQFMNRLRLADTRTHGQVKLNKKDIPEITKVGMAGVGH